MAEETKKEKRWEPEEIVATLLGITGIALPFFTGRGNKVAQSAHTIGALGGRAKGILDIANKVVEGMGIGTADEGNFPLLVEKLPPKYRAEIDRILSDVLDLPSANRFRNVAVNLIIPEKIIHHPEVQQTKVVQETKDGKTERVIRQHKAAWDETIPPDDTKAVKFLRTVASKTRGKTEEETLKYLRGLNVANSAESVAFREGLRGAVKATITGSNDVRRAIFKAVGEADWNKVNPIVLKQMLDRLAEDPRFNPDLPKPDDDAGFLVRFGRSITPLSFPNPKKEKGVRWGGILIIILLLAVFGPRGCEYVTDQVRHREDRGASVEKYWEAQPTSGSATRRP